MLPPSMYEAASAKSSSSNRCVTCVELCEHVALRCGTTAATHPERGHALRPVHGCAYSVEHAALVVGVQEGGQLVQEQHLGKQN